MRRQRRHRSTAPVGQLAVVLLVSGLLGLLALVGGWALGSVVWSREAGDSPLRMLLSAVAPTGAAAEVSSAAPPAATPPAAQIPGPWPPSPVLAGRRLVTYYGNPLSN